MIKDHPVLSIVVAFFFAWGLTGTTPFSNLITFAKSDNILLAQAIQTFGSSDGTGSDETSTGSFGTCPNLTINLSADDSGVQVTRLQQFLKDTVINGQAIHPTGEVTGFFGPITEAAVQRLQSLAGIVSAGDPDTTGYGYVGPRTRSFIALNCGKTGSIDTSSQNGSGSTGGTSTGTQSGTTGGNPQTGTGSQSPSASGTAANTVSGNPDLIITGVNATRVETGDRIPRIHVIVKNVGGDTGNRNFTISAQPVGTTQVLPTFRGVLGAVSSGKTSTITLFPLSSFSAPAGSFTYEVVVDSNNAVTESNESNNKVSATVNLQAGIAISSQAQQQGNDVRNSKQAGDCDLPTDVLSSPGIGSYSLNVSGGTFTMNASAPFAFMNKSSALGGSGAGNANPAFVKNGYTLRYVKNAVVETTPLSCASGRQTSAKRYETYITTCTAGTLSTPEKISSPASLTQEERAKIQNALLVGSCKEDNASPYYKVTPISSISPVIAKPANNNSDETSLGQPPSTLYDFGCVQEGETIEFDLEIKTISPQQNIDPVRWEVGTIEALLQGILDRNFSKEVQDRLREQGIIGAPITTPEAIVNITPKTGRKIKVSYTMPRATQGSDFPWLNPIAPRYTLRNPYTGVVLTDEMGLPGFAPKLSLNPNGAQPGNYNHPGDVVYISYAPLPRITEAGNPCPNNASAQNARIFVYAERGVDMTIPIDHTVVYNPNAVNGRTPLELRSRPNSTVTWKLAPSQAPGVIDTPDKVPSLPTTENWIRLEKTTGDSNSFIIDGLKTRAGQSFTSGSKAFSLYLWDNINQRPVEHDVYILFSEGFGSNNSANSGARLTTEQLQRGIQDYKDSVFMLPIWVAKPRTDSGGAYTDMQGEANLPGLRSPRGFLDDARFLPGYTPKSTFLYETRWVQKYAAEANFDRDERARVALEFNSVLNNLPQIFNQNYGSINFSKYGKYEFVARTYAQASLTRFANVNFALPSVDLLSERVEQFMNASIPEMLTVQVLSGNDNTMEGLRASSGSSSGLISSGYKELVPGDYYRFLRIPRSDSFTLSVDTFRWYNLEIYGKNAETKLGGYRFWNGNEPNNQSIQTWNKLGGNDSGAPNALIDSSILSLAGSAGSSSKPDYQIVSARILNGQDMIAYVTFKNNGGNLNNNKQVTVTLTPPPSSAINGLQLPTIVAKILSPLQPGETREIMLNQAHTAIMPTIIPTSGYYTYAITVDSTNILDESDETNNVLNQPVKIDARNNTQYIQSTGSIAESQYYTGTGATPINLVLEQVREIIGRPLANLTTQISNFTRCQYGEAVTPLLYNDQNNGGLFSRNRCADGGITNVGDSLDAFNVRKLVYTRGVGGAYGVSAAQTGLHLGGINISGAPSGTRLNLLTGEVTFDPSKAVTDWRTRATAKGIVQPVSFGIVPERKISQQLYDQLITEIRKSGVGAEFKYLLTDPDRNQPSGLPLFETFESRFAEFGPNNSTVRNQIQSFPWIVRPWLQYWFFANGFPHSPEKGWFDQQRQIDAGIIPARDVVNHPLLGRTTLRDVGSFERWVYSYMAPTTGIRAFLNSQVSSSDRTVLNEIISRLRNENFVGTPGTLPGEGTGEPDYVIDSVIQPFGLTPNVSVLQSIEFNLKNIGGNHSQGIQMNIQAVPVSAPAGVNLDVLPRFENNTLIGLQGGITRSLRVTSSIGRTLPAGSYQYRMTIDSVNFVEGNENNNTYDFTINVGTPGSTIPPATCTVPTINTSFASPITATVGQNLNLGFSSNQGGVTLSVEGAQSWMTANAGNISGVVPASAAGQSLSLTLKARNSCGTEIKQELRINVQSVTTSSTPAEGKVIIKFVDQNLNPLGGNLVTQGSAGVIGNEALQFRNTNGEIVVSFQNLTGPQQVYVRGSDVPGQSETFALCTSDISSSCLISNTSSYGTTGLSCTNGSFCNLTTTVEPGKIKKVVFRYTPATSVTQQETIGTFASVVDGNIKQVNDFLSALQAVGGNRNHEYFIGFRRLLYGRGASTEASQPLTNPNGYDVYKAWEAVWNAIPNKNQSPYDQGKHWQLCNAYITIFTDERAKGFNPPPNPSCILQPAGVAPLPLLQNLNIISGITPSSGVVSTGATITSASLANVKLFDYDFWRGKGWSIFAPVSEINRIVDQWNRIVDQIPYGGPEVPLHIAKAANQTAEGGGPVEFRKYERVEKEMYYQMTDYSLYIQGLNSQHTDIFRNSANLSLQSSSGSNIQNSSNPFSPEGAAISGLLNVGWASGINAFATLFPATFSAATGGATLSSLGVVCASGACYNPYTFIPIAVIALITSINGKPSVGPNCNADINISGGQASVGSVRQDNGANGETCRLIAQSAVNIINHVASTKNLSLQNSYIGVVGWFPKRGGFFMNTESPGDQTKHKYLAAPEYASLSLALSALDKNNSPISESEIIALYTKTRDDYNEFRKYLRSAFTYNEINNLITDPQDSRY